MQFADFSSEVRLYTPHLIRKHIRRARLWAFLTLGRDRWFSSEHGKYHETALGMAVWDYFRCKIDSDTSPIDLDRFRSDLDDPKIQKTSRQIESLVSYHYVS